MSEQKVALITGANKGIGLETARQLAQKGYTVLVGARGAERGAKAAQTLNDEGLDAHFLQIDVTDAVSRQAAAQKVERDFGKLDVLINNAGIALDSVPPSQLPSEIMRRTYDTNVFAPVAVIQEMLPLLRKSSAARIVNLSNGLGSLAQNSDPHWEHAAVKLLAYDSSKTALNAVAVQFASELRDAGIKVNSADPGYVATDLNGHRGERTVQQGATATVRLATLPDDGPSGGFFNEDGVVAW